MESLPLRIIAITAAAMVAVGCATTAMYEATLKTWIGQTESHLVSTWGPPDGVYEAPDGTRILTYTRGGSVQMPVNAQTTVVGNAAYTNVYGGQTINLWCKTSFTVGPAGTVTHWRWEGNNCTAR